MSAVSAIGMRLLRIAIGIPVGVLTKKAADRVWLAARPEDPPRKPDQREANWSDAIAWAALSSAALVVAELVTRRGSTAAFRAITGSEPPEPKPSRTERRLKQKVEKQALTA